MLCCEFGSRLDRVLRGRRIWTGWSPPQPGASGTLGAREVRSKLEVWARGTQGATFQAQRAVEVILASRPKTDPTDDPRYAEEEALDGDNDVAAS